MTPHNTRFFRHYKNKPYRFLGIVRHSETLEEMALYETLYENKLGKMWVRPKEMFFENIMIEGQARARFQPVQFTFKTYTHFSTELFEIFKQIYKASFGSEMNEKKYLSKIKLISEFHILVAYDNDKAVGIKVGYCLDETKFYSWLGGVLPDYQGLGIASELIRLQHQWCLSQDMKSIETRTRNRFRSMIALNLVHGFEIVGTLKDNRGLKILLEKDLSK